MGGQKGRENLTIENKTRKGQNTKKGSVERMRENGRR